MGKYWYIDASGKRKRTKAGYEHEKRTYKSSAKYKAEMASRKRARRAAEKKGLVHKGDGKDVDHRNSNPLDNSPGNIRIVSAHTNRGKRENSRRRGSRRRSWTWK